MRRGTLQTEADLRQPFRSRGFGAKLALLCALATSVASCRSSWERELEDRHPLAAAARESAADEGLEAGLQAAAAIDNPEARLSAFLAIGRDQAEAKSVDGTRAALLEGKKTIPSLGHIALRTRAYIEVGSGLHYVDATEPARECFQAAIAGAEVEPDADKRALLLDRCYFEFAFFEAQLGRLEEAKKLNALVRNDKLRGFQQEVFTAMQERRATDGDTETDKTNHDTIAPQSSNE